MRRAVVLFAIGCGRLQFDEHAPDASSHHAIDAASPPVEAPFAAPAWMGATLNSGDNDADPTLPADELELYFSSSRSGIGQDDIYRSRRPDRASAWGAPDIVGELSTTANDDSPEISADGLTMWQASDRDTGTFRIYASTRASRADAWSTPVVEPFLSTTFDDSNLAVSADGLVAVTEHLVPGSATDRDLYQHLRATPTDDWGPELHLGELSSPTIDGAPYLDATGLAIWFNSDRPGTVGEYDIYMATRATTSDPFSTPVKVDALDSPEGEGNPFLSADGHTMYMHSDRPGGMGARDLWSATR